MKILHSQINPLHGELARVRWFQADGAPVTLEIYNLLGDKVATLAENRLLNPGLQEVTWNGKTSRGAVAGSGIYIVYLQTGDTKTWAKVAVVK
jgi:flagellar hook assembly protein FlgD